VELVLAFSLLLESLGGTVNILLAEDDKNFGLVLKKELEEDDHTVDLVGNGVDAVLNFISKTYAFVLMDIKMPRLNGNDALRIMKRIKPQVPAITISGKAGSAERAESVECGAIKCLTKPFEIAQLKGDLKSFFPVESPW
jgi:DNA-binding response OmpR family regulator